MPWHDAREDVREKNAMRTVRSLVVALLAFVVFAVPSVVLADGRVALVVGNSTYAHIGRLPNPDKNQQMGGASNGVIGRASIGW